MRTFYMFMCDECGLAKERPSMCPNCKVPLALYSKKAVARFGNHVSENSHEQLIFKHRALMARQGTIFG